MHVLQQYLTSDSHSKVCRVRPPNLHAIQHPRRDDPSHVGIARFFAHKDPLKLDLVIVGVGRSREDRDGQDALLDLWHTRVCVMFGRVGPLAYAVQVLASNRDSRIKTCHADLSRLDGVDVAL